MKDKSQAKGVLNAIDKVVTTVNSALLIIALAIMFLMIFINVIGRYFFSKSVMGADELARYLMISIAFLGMGMAMRRGQHSAFNIVQDVVPSRVRIFLRIIVSLIMVAFMIVLFVLGYQYAMKYMSNRTEMLRMSAGMWYMVIPLGAVLFVFHFLIGLKEYVFMAKNADIEAEIAAGEEMTGQSEFMTAQDNDMAETTILQEQDTDEEQRG